MTLTRPFAKSNRVTDNLKSRDILCSEQSFSCSRCRHPCPPRTSRSCRWRRWPLASKAAKGRCGRAKGFCSSATTVRTGSTNTFRERRPKSIGKAPTGPTATRWIARDACTSCEYKARRVTRTDRKGRIEVLVDRFEGKRFNAPNDIVVRRDGHVYFTDPLYTPLDVRDLDFYGIYHVTPGGRIEAIARMQTRPNGVTLSPDGTILYVGNERKILAYDLNRNGQASNERVIIADLPGGPDGIRTDAKGNLYLTSSGIAVYSPAGELLGRITLPGVARNLAFGDKDLRTLYMIGNSLYRVRVPIPGSIQY